MTVSDKHSSLVLLGIHYDNKSFRVLAQRETGGGGGDV